MNYRHFTGFNENSKFEKLSGDIQRAIETQTNIDLEARKISQYFRKAFSNEDVQVKFFNKTCEEYANKDENELKKLVIKESKALYFHPLTKDMFEYYDNLAELEAKKLDNIIKYRVNGHFKEY